jgi:hypothetical protein
MDIKYQKNLINKLKKHTGKSFLANTDTERIPSNTPLACTPRKLKSNTHTKQTQEPGGSRGPHVGPSGDAPRYVSPMARSYFCKPKPDLGELIARLRCPFLPVVYVPSGRVLPLPRSTPPRACLLPPAISGTGFFVAALSWPLPRRPIPTHPLCQLAAPADSRAPRSVSRLDWPWPRSTAKGGVLV